MSQRDLLYEKSLSRLNQSLEKRRERGDFIAVYRASKDLERIDTEDLFVWNDRNTRGHEKKLKRTICMRQKNYSFPYRIIEAWNKLDAELINARIIHDFKSELDNSIFGDGTV